jgi:hypothetical protein
MENNTLRAIESTTNANAKRKCQSFVLNPVLSLGKNVFGIQVTDVFSGYGFETSDSVGPSSARSTAVRCY